MSWTPGQAFPPQGLQRISRSPIPPLREEVVSDHLGVVVNGRVDAHALDAADHLCNLALVGGPQARAGRVGDLARRRRELLHERKVLRRLRSVHMLSNLSACASTPRCNDEHQPPTRSPKQRKDGESQGLRLTLYMSSGRMPSASTTSPPRWEHLRHFCISTGLRSCGE